MSFRVPTLADVAKEFSDDKQQVLESIKDIIGFGGSVRRGIGRWVPESHHDKTLEWLLAN